MDLDQILDTLGKGVVGLAETTVKDYVAQATEDANNVINGAKSDLLRWAQEFAAGDLGAEDIAFLVQGEKELAEMHALEQAGVAKIQIEQFRNGVVDLIVNTLTGVL